MSDAKHTPLDDLVRDLAYAMQEAYGKCKTLDEAVLIAEDIADCDGYRSELACMVAAIDAFVDMNIPDMRAAEVAPDLLEACEAFLVGVRVKYKLRADEPFKCDHMNKLQQILEELEES